MAALKGIFAELALLYGSAVDAERSRVEHFTMLNDISLEDAARDLPARRNIQFKWNLDAKATPMHEPETDGVERVTKQRGTSDRLLSA